MSNQLVNQYHFIVQWGGKRIDFLEVSGLDITVEAIAVRAGSSPEENEIKVPGLTRFPDLILKRTIHRGDNEFFEWINTRRFGTIERRTLTISLLNENHAPSVTWIVKNCFPSKYCGPVLLSTDSQVATETLVITHEGFTIEHSEK